jgi:hypothetical protein
MKKKMRKLKLEKSRKTKERASHSKLLLSLSVAVFALLAAGGLTSCKAWRTVSTTATYVQTNDSAKVTQTITTKTVEEYQGVKKK